MIARHLVISY